MIRLSLSVLALFASVLPAQAIQFGDALFAPTTTVIDWGGRPAIVLLVQGENAFVSFEPAAFPITPHVFLQPQIFGAFDSRACAAQSKVSVGVYDTGLLPTVPMLSNDVLWSTHVRVCPAEIAWTSFSFAPLARQRWSASYCTAGFCPTPCGTIGQAPQWSVLVCYVGTR